MRGEEGRNQSQQTMGTLNERIGALAEAMRGNQQLMLRLAETSAGGDEVSRGHLRNIELWLQRMAAEAEQGRAETTADLRNELRVLTRTVAALSEDRR
jgi:hypothetical protein